MDLEFKIRVINQEIKETKRESDKFINIVFSAVFVFIGSIFGLYTIPKKQEYQIWIPFLIIFIIASFPAGFYWYNRYNNACQKIKKLEKELYLLKKT